MDTQKYEYLPIGKSPVVVPCAHLKEGCTGIIVRVDFYGDVDFVRGTDINFSFSYGWVLDTLGTRWQANRPISLETCTDQQLQLLSSEPLDQNNKLPLDELQQIRELEQTLRISVGEYRARR